MRSLIPLAVVLVWVGLTRGIAPLNRLQSLIRRRRPTDVATWSALAAMALDSLSMDIHRFRHLWVLLGLADADRRQLRPHHLVDGRVEERRVAEGGVHQRELVDRAGHLGCRERRLVLADG